MSLANDYYCTGCCCGLLEVMVIDDDRTLGCCYCFCSLVGMTKDPPHYTLGPMSHDMYTLVLTTDPFI